MNKKILIISLVAVLVVAVAVTIGVVLHVGDSLPEREVLVYGDYKYTITEDGKASIVGYLGDDSELVIPSSVDGRTVVEIGDGAFSEMEFVSVTLGSFVKRIGKNAFYECNSMDNFYVNDELQIIDDNAFYGCGSLNAFDFPETVHTLGVGAFYGCSDLSHVSLPLGVKRIPALCFASCAKLTQFRTASTLVEIDDYAFYDASGLLTVTLVNVERLGSYVFENCLALEDIDLGSSLKSIGSGVFYNCDALKTITVDSAGGYFTSEGGALVDIKNKTVLQMPMMTEAESYRFPDYVEYVAEYAFRNVLSLKEIILSESLKEIGTYGFYFCDNIERIVTPSAAADEKIKFPSSLTRVGGLAFERCAFFENYKEELFIVGDGVLIKFYPQVDSTMNLLDTEISTVVREDIYDPSGVLIKDKVMGISVVLPEGIKCISSAFAEVNSIVSVKLPSTVTELSDYAFYHATFLEKCDMSASAVKTIGDHAFDNCQLLETVVFPNGTLTEVGEYLFLDCYALTEITIPESLTYIGVFMFAECTKLERVILHDGVTEIKERAFNTCTALKSFTVPESVKKIGDYAFCKSGIEEFTLPEWVEAGEYLFLEATELKKITIHSDGTSPVGICMGATSLEEAYIYGDVTEIGTDSFYDCGKLALLEIPSTVTVIGDRAFQFCASLTGIGSLKLTRIGDHAFYNATSFVDFEMPKTLTTLGAYSFYGCEKLTDLDLSRVTEMGESCFANCALLEEADISGIAYVIPDKLFSNCVSLKSVKLADSVTEIGTNVFMVNRLLESVTLPESLLRLGSGAFMGCESLADVKWNDSLTYIGSKAFLWCDKITSVTLPDSVEYIGESAFEMCHYMTDFYMGDGVKQMGGSVFKECYSLKNVRLSASLDTIGDNTFYDCSSLTDFVVNDGIKTIDEYAFSGCTALTRVFIPTSVNRILYGAFSGCSALEVAGYDGTEDDFLLVYLEEGNDEFLAVFKAKAGE